MERTCKKCGETKPIEEFEKRIFKPSGNTGYRWSCKKCVNIRHIINGKKYTAIKNEKGRIRYHKDIKQSRKYNREKQKKGGWHKIYRQNHKDKCRALNKKSRIKLKDAISLRRKMPRRKEIQELADVYILNLIHDAYGVGSVILRQHPELIENYRQQIKVKRLLKSKKNDKSTKTS